MKKISIRNLIIALLCITIIFLAAGFCFISAKLDALKNKEEVFNVIFTKVEEETSVKGGTVEPNCEYSVNDDGHKLNMEFNMFNPIDELAYSITIENKGTMKAKIIDIISSPDYETDLTSLNSIKPVKITTTDISGKVLDPNEETTLKVVATYGQSSSKRNLKIPFKLSIVSSSTK